MLKFNRTAWLASVSTGLLGTGILLAPLATPTQATPKFAKKEMVSCAYCHVNANGGGKRNYRGAYYRKNDLSFAGFDDKEEAKKAGVEVAADADAHPASLTPPTMSVADATAKLKTAEAAYKKAPKDAAVKAAYVEALADMAHSTMLDQTLPAPKRFVDALATVKKTLKLDPTNKQALADKAVCESAIKVQKERGETPPAAK